MKTPRVGSGSHRVIFALYEHGAQTIDELSARLGLPKNGVMGVHHEYHFDVSDDGYSLSQAMRWHIDKLRNIATTELTPPAYRKSVFASPGLSAKYQISALGNRPGANDHLQYKSRFA